MNDDGTMNDLAFEFAGMDRFEARKAVVAKLEEIGALVKSKTYPQRWSFRAYRRCGGATLVDSMVRQDGPVAKNAIANQDRRQGRILPPRFNDTFLQWMEKCPRLGQSRQLWWGHQIPALVQC